MSEMIERAAAAAEEAMRSISVCEGADGMSYGLLDAIAEARCEKELSGAADVLRDASADVSRAALLAALDPEDEVTLEAVSQHMTGCIGSVSGRGTAKRAIEGLRKALAQGETKP